ncbi:MAG: VWA domain-containing protein [Coriobacteriia bacterium]|nr:VWA domain-containing protein [Coriobacteriia bacterium]
MKLSIKPRAQKQLFAYVCSVVLACSLGLGNALVPAFGSESEGSSPAPWQQGEYLKVSDPNTSDATQYFDQSTMENGRLWTDKSVDAAQALIYSSAGTVIGSHEAKDDEFLVTLSALSEAYSINGFTEPVDAVFMVDVSGSMTYGFEGDIEGSAGNMRVDALVEALNEATALLMQASPENRVSVVAYGGLSGRNPRAYPLLSLGRYEAPQDEFFYVSGTGTTGNARLNVNAALLGPAPLASSVSVSGGTPTQRGIYAGAQMLMANSDTTYTDPASGITIARKPVMVLLTDGEPTFGWTDYKTAGVTGGDYTLQNQNWGDALVPDMGIDLLTVASASYWKQQVHDWYFGADDIASEVGYFTIGMYVENTHSLAVLDPSRHVLGNEQLYSGNGTTYNMGELLNRFVTPFSPTGGSIEFPILDLQPYPTTAQSQGYPRSLESIANDNNYLTSYYYSTEYFQANDAEALKEAFKAIAVQAVTQGNYITEVESKDPSFSGYLTFSDVLGRYMEFRSYEGLWFEGQQFNGLTFAADIAHLGASSPNWDSFIVGLATQMGADTAPVSLADATEVVLNSMAGGSLFYNSPTSFGNQIRWYANNEKDYLSPFYHADGSVAAVPSDARCIMDLYPLEGVVTSSVTGEATDLMNTCLVVLTALQDGSFTDSDDGYIAGLTRDIVKGQQIVRWYIPASLIPMRTVAAVASSPGEQMAEIKEAEAIRAIYSVGLPASFTLADLDSDYADSFYKTPPQSQGDPGLYLFFSNFYHLDSNVTAAFCETSATNHYYHHVDPSGRVPLYVSDEAGAFHLAQQGSVEPFYASFESFDLTVPGYLVHRFTQVDSSVVVDDEGASAPYVPSGTPRAQTMTEFIPKQLNPTDTRGYVLQSHGAGFVLDQEAHALGGLAPLPFQQDISVLNNAAYTVQVYELGNNGLLGIPEPTAPPVPPTPPTPVDPPTPPTPPTPVDPPTPPTPADPPTPPSHNNPPKPPVSSEPPSTIWSATKVPAQKIPHTGDASLSLITLLLLGSGAALLVGSLAYRSKKGRRPVSSPRKSMTKSSLP